MADESRPAHQEITSIHHNEGDDAPKHYPYSTLEYYYHPSDRPVPLPPPPVISQYAQGDNGSQAKQVVDASHLHMPSEATATSGKHNLKGAKRGLGICGLRLLAACIVDAFVIASLVAAVVAGIVVSNEKTRKDRANDASLPATPTKSSPDRGASRNPSATATPCKPHLTHAASNQWYTICNDNFSPPKFLDGAFDPSSNFSAVHYNDQNYNASQEWFFMRVQPPPAIENLMRASHKRSHSIPDHQPRCAKRIRCQTWSRLNLGTVPYRSKSK